MLQRSLEHLPPFFRSYHLRTPNLFQQIASVGLVYLVGGLLMFSSILEVLIYKIESSSMHYAVGMKCDRVSWLEPSLDRMSLTSRDLIGQTVAGFMCQSVITIRSEYESSSKLFDRIDHNAYDLLQFSSSVLVATDLPTDLLQTPLCLQVQ